MYSMYVCMHVCMHVCMYLCMCVLVVRMGVCMYYIYAYTYTLCIVICPRNDMTHISSLVIIILMATPDLFHGYVEQAHRDHTLHCWPVLINSEPFIVYMYTDVKTTPTKVSLPHG